MIVVFAKPWVDQSENRYHKMHILSDYSFLVLIVFAKCCVEQCGWCIFLSTNWLETSQFIFHFYHDLATSLRKNSSTQSIIFLLIQLKLLYFVNKNIKIKLSIVEMVYLLIFCTHQLRYKIYTFMRTFKLWNVICHGTFDWFGVLYIMSLLCVWKTC